MDTQMMTKGRLGSDIAYSLLRAAEMVDSAQI